MQRAWTEVTWSQLLRSPDQGQAEQLWCQLRQPRDQGTDTLGGDWKMREESALSLPSGEFFLSKDRGIRADYRMA